MAEIGRRKGDDALLVALASGQTVRDAARAAGIGERTATRRLADPGFRQAVTELQAEMVGRAMGRLADGMVAAADTLRQLLSADGESVRLGAARSILELADRLRDVELEQRLIAVEQKLLARGTAQDS